MAGKKASKIRRNQARAAARGETYTYIPPPPKEGGDNNDNDNDNNNNNKQGLDDEAIQRRANAAQKLEETLARLESNPDNLNSKEKRTAKRKAEAIALAEALGNDGGGDDDGGDDEKGTSRCSSAEELLSWYREFRKQQAQTDGTNAGKKKRKKRKHDDDDEHDNDDEPPKLLSEEDQRKFQVAKQLHDTLAELENNANNDAAQDGNNATASTSTSTMNAKERRSAKRKAEAIATEQTGCSPEELLQWYKQYAPKQPKKNTSDNDEYNNDNKKKIPYIVFVGQLSYKTTLQSLRDHFLSILSPASFPNHDTSLLKIRLLTDPKTKSSRGMAFVELPTPELMYESLKLHLTHLDGRRINVERSSGGGKHSSLKKSKIQSFREKQSEYISKTVDGIIESFVKNGEVEEEELDDGVRGLCKRHSVQVVERALREFVEEKRSRKERKETLGEKEEEELRNPSAFLTHMIGRIAEEGIGGGDSGEKGDGGGGRGGGGRGGRGGGPGRGNGPDARRGPREKSELEKAGVDMSISRGGRGVGGCSSKIAQIFPSMQRGRGRGRGYM